MLLSCQNEDDFRVSESVQEVPQELITKTISGNEIPHIIDFIKSKSNADLTIDFLNSYLESYRIKNNADSIFLGQENSNIHIFKRFEREFKLETKDSNALVKKIFNKNEYENFLGQTIDSSSWQVDLRNFNNVYSYKLVKDKERILYVTRPMFTLDKKYALIYSYKKSKNDIYFIPAIEIFF